MNHSISFRSILTLTLISLTACSAHPKTSLIKTQNPASTSDQTTPPASSINASKNKTSISTVKRLKDGTSVSNPTQTTARFSDQDVAAATLSQNDCTPIDLSSALGAVKNQRTDGDCFAYTAAELMSYRSTEQVSALATALEYGSRMDPNATIETTSSSEVDKNVTGLDGGTIADAILSTHNAGACFEKDIISSQGESESLEVLKASFDSYLQATQSADGPEHADQLDKSSQTAVLWTSDVFPGIFKKSFKEYMVANPTSSGSDGRTNALSLFQQKVTSILQSSSNFEMFLRTLQSQACFRDNTNLPLWGGNIQDHGVSSVSDLVSAVTYIHQTLKRQYPVGVGYDVGGIIYASSGGHASTIAGRQWQKFDQHPEGCYFLVKNSWGKNWPATNDLNNLKGVRDPNHMGYFWVKDSDLAQSMISYTEIGILDQN